MESTTVCIKGEGKKLDTEEDVAHIVDLIRGCDGLTTLQLSGNSFGVDATKAIAECLAEKPSFTRALWSDMFVSRLKSEIPMSLIALGDGIMKAQACLTELDLSDNALGPTGVEPIIPLLTSYSLYSVKVLKFNNNGLGIKGGKLLAKSLLECHSEAEKAGRKLALEVFVAGRNRLENVGATALAEVFEAMGSLVSVSMPQNGINAEGICALAKAFSHNPNLETIDLNDNTFTASGAVAMADVLPKLQNLRTINFGDCLVRPDGARAIAEAIKDSHEHLKELNLSFGELDQDSGMVVAEALSNKKELEKIDLNGNCFGTNGIELLRECLEAKGCLDTLGSLSDDEGSDDEDDEEEEKEQVGGGGDDEGPTEESVKEDDRSNAENRGGEVVTKESGAEKREDRTTISLAEYLNDPTDVNLRSLGDERGRLLAEHLKSENNDTMWVTSTAAMFTTLTRTYDAHLTDEVTDMRHIVHSTLDAILQPIYSSGLAAFLVNEILVHIGLLKSEDKHFKPVKDINGPILALKYVARQNYFSKQSADILIAFFSRSHPLLLKNQMTTVEVLQVLHSV